MEIKNFIVGPLLTNCYLLVSGKEALVIDPGGDIKDVLKELEKNKAKLKFIVLTHSHWDHILGLLKLKEKTGAKVLIHQAEKNMVEFKVDKFLEEGDKIKIDKICLEVIHTPGHSPGSICLLSEGFVFTGDTLFEDGFGRTDLAGGSQKDMEKSLKRLGKVLKPGTKIYPGHGPIFEK